MPPETSIDAYASAVLLAAGSSTRMGLGQHGERKPFLKLAGRTLVEHAITTFSRAACVGQIVLVGHAEDLDAIQALLESTGNTTALCIAGGAERTDSVRLGFAKTHAESEVVLVHDVARPLVRPEQVDAVASAARAQGGALLATPVRDTIKMCSDGRAISTLDRSRLWAAQTPQAFQRSTFARVLEEARAMNQAATDDAALYERYAGPVALVEGGPENLKLTVPGDLALAEAVLSLRGVRS